MMRHRPPAETGFFNSPTIHTYILHRAHREPIYRAIGRHLEGVHPCGTGLIVDGFARPEIPVEIDVVAVIQD